MKQILLTAILATGFLFGGNYTTDQASNHIGENATVCGVVTGFIDSHKGIPQIEISKKSQLK